MRKINWIICFLILISCGRGSQKLKYNLYQGYGAGFPITIEYDNKAGDLSQQITGLIMEIESSVWTDDSNSIIAKVNKHDSGVIKINSHFGDLLALSKSYYSQTERVIDPTTTPLLQYWGTHQVKFKLLSHTDSSTIDSLMKLKGLEKFIVNSNQEIQSPSSLIIDFKPILAGYMVDALVDLLQSYQVENFRVEVNGIILANGLDAAGKDWLVGLDLPTDKPNDRMLLALMKLNGAVATGGSYREYYTKGGIKFPFIINPVNGYPVQHSLIQVMVFAESAVKAQAFAEAFMVMGMEKSKIFLQSQNNVSAYFIYANYKGEWNTYMSPQLKDQVEMMKIENPI